MIKLENNHATMACCLRGQCKNCLWAWDDSLAHDIIKEEIPAGKYLCCSPDGSQHYHEVMNGTHTGCKWFEKRH